MKFKGEIIGQAIILRTCLLSDCNETYVKWLNDPLVNMYLETRFSEQTLHSISEFVDSNLKSESSYLYAIITNDSEKKHIGNIKLGPIHPHYAYADISYFIGDIDYWGKGIAAEAIKLVVDFAFTQLKLRRLQAGAFEDNIGSIKALEKAGFELEGRFREKLYTQGKWQDHLYYGLLNENEER